MQLQAVALAVLYMIHGASADCDEAQANVFISHIDQFNVMLSSFANLGSSLLAASATPTAKAKKSGGHLLKREASKPTSSAHVGAKSHSHVAAHARESGKAVSVAQSSGEPQKMLHKQLQKSYDDLRKQQSQLNSLSDSCIPSSHKLKVVSQLTNMLDTYIGKEKPLKAAGKQIVEKKRSVAKNGKRTSEEKEQRKQERQLRRREIVRRSLARESNAVAPNISPVQAAWLTMADGVNSGYNDDQSELTASPTDSSDTTSTSYASFAPYPYNSPQLEPQFVTLTSTGSVEITPPAPPAPSTHGKSSKQADSGSETESGTESESETGSEDETSQTVVSTAAAPLATTKAHHNVIISSIDGAYHLVTGSLHLVSNIFHSIFLVDDKQIVSDNEISKLVDRTKQIYNVKH